MLLFLRGKRKKMHAEMRCEFSMIAKIIQPEEIGQAVIYKVDWPALFQFHIERSMDSSLSASRRCWHEAQACAVRSRHLGRSPDATRTIKTLLMASLAQMWKARHVKVRKNQETFNWPKLCAEARASLDWHGFCNARARAPVIFKS